MSTPITRSGPTPIRRCGSRAPPLTTSWGSNMLYARRPALPLSTWVDQLWYCENYQSTYRRERVLPGGTFDLILDLACGAPPLVCGIRSGYVLIETALLRSILGVVFRPGGARAFFAA